MEEEKRLNHLLDEYTPDKYEQNRIYIQQEDQNKFKVVYNPVTATTATGLYTKEQILQKLDSIYGLIEYLKDARYHIVKEDAEEDGFLVASFFTGLVCFFNCFCILTFLTAFFTGFLTTFAFADFFTVLLFLFTFLFFFFMLFFV